MNKLKLPAIALAFAMGSTASIAEECVAPTAVPTVPEGATSTMEQMLEGQKAVKAFQADNMAYLLCMDPKLAAAQEDVVAGSEEAVAAAEKLQESYNAAVSREEALASQFNTAIREYKAANPAPTPK